MRIERRSATPRWLQVAVPLGSIAVALVDLGHRLLVTGHNPLHAYRRLFEAAFTDPGALSATLTAATPLCFTGLAAAVAFRVGLFNIGAEGQLYMGAIAAAGVALALAGQGTAIQIAAMVVAGGLAGAAWALVPGLLRAFANTNEIITSLMLNYVAALFLNYLIFDTLSYWRDTSSPGADQFPPGQGAAGCRLLADLRPRHEPRDPVRAARRRRARRHRRRALRAHALRLRGGRDRRLATRRALRRACARGATSCS